MRWEMVNDTMFDVREGVVKCDLCDQYTRAGFYIEPETEEEFQLVKAKNENPTCIFVGRCCFLRPDSGKLMALLERRPKITRPSEMVPQIQYSNVDKRITDKDVIRLIAKFGKDLSEHHNVSAENRFCHAFSGCLHAL